MDINIESNTTWRGTLMAASSVVPRGSFSGDNIDVSSLGTELVINKSGTGILSFAFEANTASAPRTVMLRLVALDGSTVLSDPAPIDVSIIQAGTASTPPTLDISGTGINRPTGSSTDFTANADAAGKTLTVAVAVGNATGWSATETTDTNNAISLSNSATGGNGGTLAITIALNATTSTRTATVTFTSTGGTGTAATQTLVITQAAAQTSPTLTISGSRINDPTNSEPNYTYNTSTIGSTLNVSVAIGNATGWSATETTDANDLITLPNSASGVDGGTLVVTITRATTTRRTATITFTSTGGTGTAATQTLVITQAGVVRTLSVPGGVTTYNIPSSIFPLDAINIESNTTWRAVITEPETVVVSMVSSRNGRLITNSGSGVVVDDFNGSTLLINFAANTETTPRDIILTLSGRDGSNMVTTNPTPITITITQAGAAALTPTLTLSGTGVTAPSGSEENYTADADAAGKMLTVDVDLENATEWAFSTTDAFVTSNPAMGGNDDDAVLTITENTTSSQRTATITFTSTGGIGTAATKTLVITQQAGAVRTLSVPGGVTTYNIPSSAARFDAINIESNTTWRAAITEPETVVVSMVSSNEDILITNLGSGVVVDDFNGSTLLINFAANTETTPRDIILTLSGRDGSNLVTTNPASITITITQAAAAAQTSPKIMLTSHTEGDSIAIVHDNIDPITIDFTLEGSATGWTDTIIYTPDTTNFITMDTLKDDTISITITPSVNTSAAPRTATITLITTGHEGTPDSVSLTIIQGARADTTTLYSYTRVDFSLYPNPTKGKLTVEGVTGYLQIYIHDLVGREVMTYSLTPSKKTIDVSNLPSGMYVVTLQGEDKTWTEVLIMVN